MRAAILKFFSKKKLKKLSDVISKLFKDKIFLKKGNKCLGTKIADGNISFVVKLLDSCIEEHKTELFIPEKIGNNPKVITIDEFMKQNNPNNDYELSLRLFSIFYNEREKILKKKNSTKLTEISTKISTKILRELEFFYSQKMSLSQKLKSDGIDFVVKTLSNIGVDNKRISELLGIEPIYIESSVLGNKVHSLLPKAFQTKVPTNIKIGSTRHNNQKASHGIAGKNTDIQKYKNKMMKQFKQQNPPLTLPSPIISDVPVY